MNLKTFFTTGLIGLSALLTAHAAHADRYACNINITDNDNRATHVRVFPMSHLDEGSVIPEPGQPFVGGSGSIEKLVDYTRESGEKIQILITSAVEYTGKFDFPVAIPLFDFDFNVSIRREGERNLQLVHKHRSQGSAYVTGYQLINDNLTHHDFVVTQGVAPKDAVRGRIHIHFFCTPDHRDPIDFP